MDLLAVEAEIEVLQEKRDFYKQEMEKYAKQLDEQQAELEKKQKRLASTKRVLSSLKCKKHATEQTLASRQSIRRLQLEIEALEQRKKCVKKAKEKELARLQRSLQLDVCVNTCRAPCSPCYRCT